MPCTQLITVILKSTQELLGRPLTFFGLELTTSELCCWNLYQIFTAIQITNISHFWKKTKIIRKKLVHNFEKLLQKLDTTGQKYAAEPRSCNTKFINNVL